MKGLRWTHLALALPVLLTGCKGFWDKTTGGGGGGGGAASGVFYVMSPAKSQVIGYGFASGATTPTAIANGTITLGAAPQAMAITPSGSYLYVSSGGIFVYSIGSGGALTAVSTAAGNGSISSETPTAMAVDGTGTWLIESLSGSGRLNAIPISTSTGDFDTTRTEEQAVLPSLVIAGIAASPANSTSPYAFVAMGSGGTEVIPFTATSSGNPFGTLAHISAKSTVGGANAIAVDPTNRLLYVGETAAVTGTQTGGLRVFTIGTSAITEVATQPYPSGTGPSAILPSADGNFVYVANRAVSGATVGNIAAYPINISAGKYSLGTLINTINAGNTTIGLAEDSTHTYVLAVNANGNPDISTYTFDTTTTGKLVAGQTVSNSLTPTAVIALQ